VEWIVAAKWFDMAGMEHQRSEDLQDSSPRIYIGKAGSLQTLLESPILGQRD
jgi:hypothetical protein